MGTGMQRTIRGRFESPETWRCVRDALRSSVGVARDRMCRSRTTREHAGYG
jgi:hypothetical protein